MNKTEFFKIMLRWKHLLKKIDTGLSNEEKDELKKILDRFWYVPFTDEEEKYIKNKYWVEKTKLDTAIKDY